MIGNLVLFLETHVLPWGALGVFIASVVEEVIAPIPSALIMTLSGFLFVPDLFSLGSFYDLVLKVALPAAFGVTIGSYVIYLLARFGGRFIVEKWGKYIGLYMKDVDRLADRLSHTRKDEFIIALARVIPIVPSVAISALCGFLEMSYGKYFVVTFVGMFLRALILGYLGSQVGGLYIRYAETINSIEKLILLSTILIVFVFIVLKYSKRR
jgi:membrane protein DedA with SNARE-associated domain